MRTLGWKVCSKAFFGLYKIRQIWKFLSDDATKALVHAFVTSHVDYCTPCFTECHSTNLTIYSVSLMPQPTSSAISHGILMFQLHWLPVASRIRFKIELLVYKALKGCSPSYITELLHIKPPGRQALRGDDQHLLLVPRTKCKTFGDHAFAVGGPRVWNSLPLAIRNSANVDTFKANLKTFFYLGI